MAKSSCALKLLATTALCLGGQGAAMAQEAEGAAAGNDIIVTARRVEERLQDVPISISVLSQEKLTQNNIANIKDLAAYTPGLNVNSRFGADNTTFAIRGFTQDQRTSATVGTYFADVVAPRGSGANFGGDGAGPGALFDLQNVQVLKGPQGTLFGRNTTGGAVLLVPRKPTDRLEGYVEGSIGDYDMRRGQAVLNVPLAETFKLRLGVDRMVRDGYLRNIGNLGDGRNGRNKGMGDVDYWAARASIVADLTPDLENYTVATYAKTRSNGIIPKLTKCAGPGFFPPPLLPGGAGQALGPLGFIPLGAMCVDQMAREAPFDPWTVSNRLPTSLSKTETWQIINTTTWKASDSLTVKGILSYGEFRGSTNIDVYGNYGIRPGVTPGTETSGNQVTGFAFIAADPISGYTNAQSTFVGEFQLQGHPGDGRFVWQVGAYTEINDPLGFSGSQTATFSACNDPSVFDCLGPTPSFSLGSANHSISATKFRNYAVYGQASYNLTDKLKLTAGLRYTWDKQDAEIHLTNVNFLAGTVVCTNVTARVPGEPNYPISQRHIVCGQNLRQNTEAPTWLINLDYKPIENVMIYAKWARGYRQGGLALFGADTIQPYDEEKVENYEVGVKSSWNGPVPGTFNIAGFYNDFSNQQLLVGVSCQLGANPNPTCTPMPAATANVLNAGKSRLYGLEAELTLRPFDGFRLEVAYAYLNSKLQEITNPTLPPDSLYNTFSRPFVGGPVPNSQPHKLTVGANYTLPLPDSVGRVTLGGLYVYTSAYQVTADACPTAGFAGGCVVAAPGEARLPGTHVLNLNLAWEEIAGMPVDASVFVTNVTNEVVILNRNDSLIQRGFVSSLLGEPRMWGVRLKYRFGD